MQNGIEKSAGCGQCCARPPLFSRGVIAALLGVFALVIFLERLHTFNEPLERDITTYAVIAHEAGRGRELYSDLRDNKPPLLYLTFAVAQALVGYGAQQVFLINLVLALTTLFGIHTAVRLLCRREGVALLGALLWTLLGGDLSLHANQPNTESFLNAFLIWAFVFLLRFQSRQKYSMLVMAGVCLAFATGYKHTACIHGLMFFLVLLGLQKTNGAKTLVKSFVCLALPGIILWLTLFCYFATTHRLDAFYDCLFGSNLGVVSNFWLNVVAGFSARLFPAELIFALPLFVLSLLGVLMVRDRWGRAVGGFLMAYFVANAVAISLAGRFHPHYYQLWLPALVVAGVWGGQIIFERFPSITPRMTQVVIAALLLWMGFYEIPAYTKSSDEWSRIKYGEIFVVSKSLGIQIAERLKPDETFFEWGNESGLYFSSKRSPLTGVFFTYELVAGPSRDRLLSGVLKQFEHQPPDLFIENLDQKIAPAMLEWVNAKYRPIQKIKRGSVQLNVFVLKNSNLDQRALMGGAPLFTL